MTELIDLMVKVETVVKPVGRDEESMTWIIVVGCERWSKDQARVSMAVERHLGNNEAVVEFAVAENED